MSAKLASPWTQEDFDRHALEFAAALTPEDVMENSWAGTQRSLTLSMFDILRTREPRVQPFNEMLVQFEENGVIKGVVPDNMIVVSDEPLRHRTSFPVPVEPVLPLLVIEYVSKGGDKKDYVVNRRRYALVGVPYYVICDPQKSKLEVHHLQDDGYVRLEPGLNNRVSVPELDLEIGLLNGWMRFWHRGELLPIPAESERQKEALQRDKKALQRHKKALQRDKKSLQHEHQQFTDWLRRSVESRARKTGRMDVLEQIPTASLAMLQRWNDEL